MRKILIVGAGKSSPYLIKYLLDKSQEEELLIHITDLDTNHLKKYQKYKNCRVSPINISSEKEREEFISESNLVISMLPARFHIILAKSCLKLKRNLLTASYVSEEMKTLTNDIKNSELLFLNEMGLDPGIDHMSAKKIIDELLANGAKINSFKSYTGGLIAPESDNNKWNYKFTWNPRNVVLAGQGIPAKYIENNKYKYIPYNRLFKNTEKIKIEKYGQFEVYPNRDSLKYREIYSLNNIKTMIRGTIRKVGFSESWNMFVKLGLTNDSFKISNSENMCFKEYVNCFLPYDDKLSIEEKLQRVLSISKGDENWEKIKEIDILSSNKKIPLKNASPAQILEYILKDAWKLEKKDKDMIVMYHEFGYETSLGENEKIISTMVCKGKDDTYTAMAKTVGLPLAISSILLLNNKINLTGIHTPIDKEIYNPVLKELEANGINFEEY
ncbi:MAG: saccharopine dehydrogenase NADP-binding domain-containing protein [Flavobacteriaceae bacterium]|nr:saccharopine dehydrogenase NADP-binding domain-containing protein [Flavobacteriaceae bacterium]